VTPLASKGGPRAGCKPGAPHAAQPNANAFDLGGAGAAAALCLHGLTGTPYEIRPLGEALARSGVRAVGPVLPGHNATPETLARVPYTAWLEAARHELHALRAAHERVFLVGLSLGGLLSLALAAEEPVDAMVVVGTPLRLRPGLAFAVRLLRYLHPYPQKRRGSDIRDGAARTAHPGYRVMPLASVRQLEKLQRRVRAALPRVTAPILVAHGRLDGTADPNDARVIAARVGSPERELLLLSRSGHVVPVDHDGPELGRAASEFLIRLRPASAAAGSATLRA
jgi:carboxylesterase